VVVVGVAVVAGASVVGAVVVSGASGASVVSVATVVAEGDVSSLSLPQAVATITAAKRTAVKRMPVPRFLNVIFIVSPPWVGLF
jgi:hypothetical protein